MIGIVYDESFLMHKPPRQHVENPERVLAIMSALNPLRPIIDGPVRGALDWVRRVHDEFYVETIEGACGQGPMFIDADTYVSPRTCEAAVNAVGAVIRGVDRVLSGEWDSAYAVVRPPGHHAGFSGRALMAPTQGFCIFNNVAVGARYALERGVRKVLILDIDVHHGNGTQEIFYSNPRVLYISLHQDPLTLYPGTGFIHEVGEGEGAGFNVNIPLPPGTGDDAYIEALDTVVWPITEQFKPDLIMVSLGFDAHMLERIASLRLTLNTYRELFTKLRNLIGRVRGVVYVLEGGYNYDVLARGSELLVRTMEGREVEVGEEPSETEPTVLARVRKNLEEVREMLRDYWNLA
ncbi:histone deacetylase family protein [Vulcanisaeta thermophila]|uniref:histone deacetylase family protein n=1 Tax=Vulcanisaeta thermophila TaxID=867917 RepID=UPI000A020683|nr:histone deacetylase [Vulcanisaeta thermophila]